MRKRRISMRTCGLKKLEWKSQSRTEIMFQKNFGQNFFDRNFLVWIFFWKQIFRISFSCRILGSRCMLWGAAAWTVQVDINPYRWKYPLVSEKEITLFRSLFFSTNIFYDIFSEFLLVEKILTDNLFDRKFFVWFFSIMFFFQKTKFQTSLVSSLNLSV